ncbi:MULTISPECIES: globin domain-containing protein [unclassified Streptomyces]|uniref:globin domain-containing protein n=1 Tax=unclassified Streptomyces TaxID=2593676 RepID=UPI000887B5BB|nr:MULTISPECIES: globin domain-containing protein [unclassified Streptomyces]PBC83731.1 NAD(P)H-flavin reductase [Streptomyces sp. 2321.6]SDR39382.1 NAD(P)H-flavin reductase [Streptomyces sp. KS_16]SED06092.1 NAD(P)H-flavin reductase [Streptomyces sp. 2133.1]SNC69810.1 NAD(P)H-flavin reductase [Streptomyces sp. 2114.4]
MDAPTTTSADSGSSGGSSGDWGWFTPPAKKSSGEQQERQNSQDRQQNQDAPAEPGDRSEHPDHGDRRDRHEWNERDERNDREQIPSRPVNPIRPVGTAAARERETEPSQAPSPRHEADRPSAAAGYPEQPFPAGYLEQPFPAAYPEQSTAAPGTTTAPGNTAVPGSGSVSGNTAPAPAPPRREAEPAWRGEPPMDRQSVREREPARGREPEPVHETARATGAPAGAPTGGVPAAAPAAQHQAPAAPPAFTPTTRPAAPAPAPSLDALQASASSATPASPDALLIRRTMAEIEPVADKVTSYFYALLFVQYPDLRALFPASMDTQRDRLFKALLTAAQHVDDAEVLTAYLANLGRGHRKYGTQPDHYPAVGECLLNALARYATSSWGPETQAAWVRAYTAISQIMIDAAAEDEAVAPAWWQAEVVSHELRTPDIAVVLVRPDQPYPFLAGQYASVETPWWPRVWRHYSFACAPRSDGLLSFHVKAVPAGWVSNAMVHRARPGDVIRLGAPGGTMTVDHSKRSGLLCVGGGTGIAPIKALVEDVAEHGVRRPVEVFYGARSDHDLYDLDTMLQLEQTHPWLSVRPVVASGPAARGGTSSERGQLPDAVRQYGPFREYDAYLSGPPGLIRSGVDALVGVGIPTERIRHDSVEELVPAGD